MRITKYRHYKENGEDQIQVFEYDHVRSFYPSFNAGYILMFFKKNSSYYNVNKDHSLWVDTDEHDTWTIQEEN